MLIYSTAELFVLQRHPLVFFFDGALVPATFILMMCDADCARLIPVNSPSAEEEDIDVAQERQRVHDGRAQNDLLRICDLTKVDHYFLLSSLKRSSV